jgi:NAD(P)-dependent dehydrogenase (short-subunit alcohol dehydrogenase family)
MEKSPTAARVDWPVRRRSSRIGRAVAIAYAREGADMLIAYLNEHEDAKQTDRLVRDAERKAVLVPGDVQHADHCRSIVKKSVSELGGIDILVNNAAHQASFKSIEDISDEEWELTFKVNIHAMFYLTKAAVPHMRPGSAIITTASINSDIPNPTLAGICDDERRDTEFTAGLAQLLAEKGIRANTVAPGPIWTPLIPSTMPEDAVTKFGKQVPMQRPEQPAELMTTYVMLADPLSSYVSGATIAVTGPCKDCTYAKSLHAPFGPPRFRKVPSVLQFAWKIGPRNLYHVTVGSRGHLTRGMVSAFCPSRSDAQNQTVDRLSCRARFLAPSRGSQSALMTAL